MPLPEMTTHLTLTTDLANRCLQTVTQITVDNKSDTYTDNEDWADLEENVAVSLASDVGQCLTSWKDTAYLLQHVIGKHLHASRTAP